MNKFVKVLKVILNILTLYIVPIIKKIIAMKKEK